VLKLITKTFDYGGELEHRNKGFGAMSLIRCLGVEKISE
jgi:hypothetical protein